MGESATGKIAVVSGGASGVGAATAQLLVEEGATVVIADVNVKAGHELAERLGSRASFSRLDVTSERNWREVVESASNEHGRFDVLVNSAGISGGNATIEEITLDNWNDVFAINATGAMLGCKCAVLSMAHFDNGGSIVNVSSTLSMKVMAHKIAYSASKAAMTHLTKAVALHCGKAGYRIRCNSVHPGAIDTPMNDELLPSFDNNREAMIREIGKFQALGRVAQPWEVAAAILYLVSDQAQFVTGSELLVDGGFMLL